MGIWNWEGKKYGDSLKAMQGRAFWIARFECCWCVLRWGRCLICGTVEGGDITHVARLCELGSLIQLVTRPGMKVCLMNMSESTVQFRRGGALQRYCVLKDRWV